MTAFHIDCGCVLAEVQSTTRLDWQKTSCADNHFNEAQLPMPELISMAPEQPPFPKNIPREKAVGEHAPFVRISSFKTECALNIVALNLLTAKPGNEWQNPLLKLKFLKNL